MNDLISRSEAMENYCNALCPKLQKGEYCNDCIIKAWLNNQPTAFDVDKAVCQMKRDKITDCETILSDIYQGYNAGLSRAIDIVKRGGDIELSEHSKSQGNRTGKQKATIEAESKAE